MSWGVALALAGVLAVVGAIIALPADSSSPSAAPSQVTVAPDGSDDACSRNGSACATLDRAYQLALPGDTITVAAGTYPGETIIGDPSKADQPITVQAAGATFGGLTFAGVRHLVIEGISVTGVFNFRPLPLLGTTDDAAIVPEDVAVVNAELRVFTLRNVNGFTLRDSRVGGHDVSTSGLGVPKVGGYPSTPYRPSTGVVLERVEFHDIIRTVPESTHAECLFIDGGTAGITIRDSSFTNCGVFDVFGGQSSAGPIADVTIERSTLDIPRDTEGAAAPSALNFKGGISNLIVRQNSILGDVRIDEASYPGLRIQRNAIGNTGCSFVPASAWIGNVLTTSCGFNTEAEPGFVSASRARCDLSSCFRNDLRVLAGSPAASASAGVIAATPPAPIPPPADTTPPPANPGVPACDNGVDDDGDGKIDLADPGCGSHTDTDETDRVTQGATAASAPSQAALPVGTQRSTAVRPVAVPGTEILQRGDEADEVRALQRALDLLGYDAGRIDGVYGVMTEQAVIAFQRDEGLARDGVAGMKTISALNAAFAHG